MWIWGERNQGCFYRLHRAMGQRGALLGSAIEVEDDAPLPRKVRLSSSSFAPRGPGGQSPKRPPAPRSSDPQSPLQERRIAEYTLSTVLGGGGEASVYLATTARYPGRQFALKIVSMKAGETAASFPEIKALKSLDHPNLLRCYGIDEVEGKLLLLLEFCVGGTLHEELELLTPGVGLGRARFLEVAGQLVSAVKYLHSQQVAHSDLKPSNILYRDRERHCAVLGDFGLSTGGKVGSTDRRGGSRYFEPPEAWRRGTCDPLAGDVWSLGVIFIWMLNGEKPWDAGNEEQLINQICGCDFALSPGVGSDIEAMVKRMVCDRSGRASIVEISEMPVFRAGLPALPVAKSGGLPRRSSGSVRSIHSLSAFPHLPWLEGGRVVHGPDAVEEG